MPRSTAPHTRAPCAPSASAMDRPMPRDAPVTMHTGEATVARVAVGVRSPD